MLASYQDRKPFKKICVVGDYLFGYNFENIVEIWDLSDMSIKI